MVAYQETFVLYAIEFILEYDQYHRKLFHVPAILEYLYILDTI